ncbi:TetR/AcrR family transcriptional regulator [Oxalobacteraceae bacterium A2-2]
MTVPPTTTLNARKKPRQARAKATLDAIFEATIQVLLTDGQQRLTTTRVSERAGVSVGTMYQYFPHKSALIYALNGRYLEVLAEKVEQVCFAQRGASVERMVAALVSTYWSVKMERPEVTRVLYQTVVEMDNRPLIAEFARRVDAATAAMLASASDAVFVDLPTVTLTLLTTVFGTVRNVFERELSPSDANAVLGQLVVMCLAYLTCVSRARGRQP